MNEDQKAYIAQLLLDRQSCLNDSIDYSSSDELDLIDGWREELAMIETTLIAL